MLSKFQPEIALLENTDGLGDAPEKDSDAFSLELIAGIASVSAFLMVCLSMCLGLCLCLVICELHLCVCLRLGQCVEAAVSGALNITRSTFTFPRV